MQIVALGRDAVPVVPRLARVREAEAAGVPVGEVGRTEAAVPVVPRLVEGVPIDAVQTVHVEAEVSHVPHTVSFSLTCWNSVLPPWQVSPANFKEHLLCLIVFYLRELQCT